MIIGSFIFLDFGTQILCNSLEFKAAQVLSQGQDFKLCSFSIIEKKFPDIT
jgi:hypothetical protein